MEDAKLPDINSQIKQIKTVIESIQESLIDSDVPTREKNLNQLAKLSTILYNFENTVKQTLSERNNLLTLADIGGTINSSLDSNEILEIVIDTIIQLTGAERCFLMLRDEESEFKIKIGRNWKQETLTPEEKAFSSTIVNRVVESGKGILTTNAQEDPRFENQASIIDFKLRSVLCVPLEAKGEIIGTIYIDNRSIPEQFNPKMLTLLEAFANQAAIALQNASLFEGLQESHQELSDAYTNTLEGWAKALELKDKVTQGHTLRVAELTLRLAEKMNVDEEELTHIQWGAILHDIGKMGIPDSILNKPGKLTKKEWAIMHRHPNYAYEMLSDIEFLKPALDIPLYHHEKWDGSGYPKKLAGEDIPLAARIFCIADVWDAMTSDRPYREALSKEEVSAHIKEQTGKHFDPKIINIFLKLINSK
jgi:putative nucleotidyltransferase with HDIG domain